MAPSKITLYVDIVSPFAYIAYHVLQHDPIFQSTSVQIEYVPVFLGGIMKATGNQPPISIKNKREWIGTERDRWAKLFNIPLKEGNPPGFPPMTLYLMRVLCALTIIDPAQATLQKAVDKLYEELWTKHTDISKPENYEAIVIAAVGEEKGIKAIELAPTQGKELVLKNSAQAVKEGAFGLPWFVVTNSQGKTEAFWGVDHMGQVADFLGLDRLKTGKVAWKALL